MPCIEEWLSNPLLLIDQKIGVDDDSLIKQVQEYFAERIKKNGINKVQSLNEKSLDHIKPNTLVRFRCMIQDMFEPEYYLSRYETINTRSGAKETNLGLYRDVASYKPGHEVNMNSAQNVTRERQCFYCVPIPGETTWAKRAYTKASGPCNSKPDFTNTKSTGMLKRGVDELQDSSEIDQPQSENMMLEGSSNEAEASSDKKKTKSETHEENASRNITVGNADLNFPLPDEKGVACMIKIYDESETYKVNDIVEFVGILSVDPQLTRFENQSDSSAVDIMEVEDDNPHSLPSSIVPRLHAVVSFKLEHSNPFLSTVISDIESQFSEVSHCREALLKLFEDMLYGDSLAAEYLLFHLLSTVYSRPDVLALGKFTLNLIGCSKDVAKDIYEMVEYLVSKCCRFPMTIDNINKSKLVPKKDYKTNRLFSGALQLSDNTHMVIDETVLEEGQLDSNGVQNLAAINHVISWQKLQYDFGFYKTDFLTNVIILVLSEGKSLLQADCRVQIISKRPPLSFEKVLQNFDDNLINTVRKYVGFAHVMKYEISPDVQKYIEDDFVEMRRADTNGITVEKFHSLLSLARLMAISHGRKLLSKGDWIRTKQLEELRENGLNRRSSPY